MLGYIYNVTDHVTDHVTGHVTGHLQKNVWLSFSFLVCNSLTKLQLVCKLSEILIMEIFFDELGDWVLYLLAYILYCI